MHVYSPYLQGGHGVAPYKLTVATTGNVALTDGNNAIIWQTNTGGH